MKVWLSRLFGGATGAANSAIYGVKVNTGIETQEQEISIDSWLER